MGDLTDLCALLRELDDPDRFNRPADFDPLVAATRFEELRFWLAEHHGPVTTAIAPDGEQQGLLSFGIPRTDLVISKYGRFFSTDGYLPKELEKQLIFDLHFGMTLPLAALDRPEPGAERYRPLDSRTPDGLAAQILALPDTPTELGELRAWLCHDLGLPTTPGGPAAAEFPEHQLLVTAERLKAIRTTAPEDRPWLPIDDVILTSVATIAGATHVRRVFGVGVHEAVRMTLDRREVLTEIRPYAAVLMRD
ncbi:hypothetical protein GCM10029964_072240 [Kibdelosporangium lantanae]